jgi:serine/threonine-protein kinase
MPLETGARLGPYVVTGRLGVGAMGEVYRAHDSTLRRDVALKVLPDAVGLVPDRLARFRREAQVLAALNHPNIAAIYGVEESTAVRALVLELVEGSTLTDIPRPLAVEDAVSIARQIADALAAAHEQGIVHRDLKPANIRIRADGTVKLLDFGLAKAIEPSTSATRAADVAATQTTPPLTEAGLLVGTPAYMSPEQARGVPVDRRADVWAFGCVLFEMLAGRPPFGTATSASDAIAALLKSDPDWKALPSTTPAGIRTLLRQCLEKDPRRRLRDIGDAALLLEEAIAPAREGTPASHPSTAGAGLPRAAVAAAVALAAVLGAGASHVWWPSGRPVEPAIPMRLAVPLDGPLDASIGVMRRIALSPDGRRIAYVGRRAGVSSLYVQDLSTGEARAIPNTADADGPLFSVDGTALGFHVGGRVRSVPLAGGVPRDMGSANGARGWAWLSPEHIVVGGAETGLVRTSGQESRADVLVPAGADGATLDGPVPLPGGAFLVAARAREARADDRVQIVAIHRSGERHVLVESGGSPAFVPAPGRSMRRGYLLYAIGGQVMAAPLDLDRLVLTGKAVAVMDDVAMLSNGDGAQYSASADGSVLYLEESLQEIVRVDRHGTARVLSTAARRYGLPRIAPDGRRIALELRDAPHQVWLLDTDRDVLTQLTTSPGGSHEVAWSPDGRSLIVTETQEGRPQLVWLPVDGSRPPVPLRSSDDRPVRVEHWHGGGSLLSVRRGSADDAAVEVLQVTGATPPVVGKSLLVLPPGSASSSISPDARWIAYGLVPPSSQVFISRIADGARTLIATDAGEPIWSRTGRELFFRSASGATTMAVDVDTTGPEPRIGRTRRLFDGAFLRGANAPNYAVGPDGQSFVMTRRAVGEVRSLAIRLNLLADLERLFPAQP